MQLKKNPGFKLYTGLRFIGMLIFIVCASALIIAGLQIVYSDLRQQDNSNQSIELIENGFNVGFHEKQTGRKYAVINSFDKNLYDSNISGKLTLPSVIQGKPIIRIADKAFKNLNNYNENQLNKITKVDFSNMVYLEEIGNNAFASSQIKTLDFTGLSNLKTIGSYAFYNNHISDIIICDLQKLENIKDYAFAKNNITNLCLNGLSKLKVIDNKAFSENNLEEVTFDNLPMLMTIGNELFKDNDLEKVTFRNIGYYGRDHYLDISLNIFRGNDNLISCQILFINIWRQDKELLFEINYDQPCTNMKVIINNEW